MTLASRQIGTAFASRTGSASLRQVGLLTNPLLLWGIAFEVAFAAALVYLPPLQQLFGTAALGPVTLATIAPFPVAVWGSTSRTGSTGAYGTGDGAGPTSRRCRPFGARRFVCPG